MQPDKLRFDFNAKALDIKQLTEVQRICREKVAAKLPIYTKLLPLPEAQKISSLRWVWLAWLT